MFTRNNSIQIRAKAKLLGGCAFIGLSALIAPSALAQLAANPINIGAGNYTVATTGTQTDVTITGPNNQAYIQWNPTAPTVDGVIDVLPNGSALNFAGSGNYTVLNHFVTSGGGALTDMIALNGAVNTYSTDVSGLGVGNIWFQNAGGILVGSTGVFNVGSLVLTSREITQTGGSLGDGGLIEFGGSGASGAVINRGTINANNSAINSSTYVAIVAPSITQAGIISANGSIAYVAAEAANITVNGGLFDIQMLVGSNGALVDGEQRAITHSGNSYTTENSATQNVYLAALPKNDAITLLVGGELGFAGGSASVTYDGNIVIAAGRDVQNGALAVNPVADLALANIDLTPVAFPESSILTPTTPPTAGTTRPTIFNGVLTGSATGSITGTLGAGQSLTFNGPATLSGQTAVDVAVTSGGILEASQLTLRSEGAGPNGGRAALSNSGGTITISDYLTIDASDAPSANPSNSTAGTAELLISGGTTNVTERIEIRADSNRIFSSGASNANATAGTARLTHSGGALQTAFIDLTADAYAGNGSSGVAGGNALGGNIFVNLGPNDSVTSAIGGLNLSANGNGGDGGESGAGTNGGNGGFGRGGTITMEYASASQTPPSAITITANGTGGEGGVYSSTAGVAGMGGTGGLGQGGIVNFTFSTATNAGLSANIDANGVGGQAGSSELSGFNALPAIQQGPSGGAGIGGTIQASLSGDFDDVELYQYATGQGGDGGSSFSGGAGGAATGGTIGLTISNSAGRVETYEAQVDANGGNGANGQLGSGGAGGASTAGSITITATGLSTDAALSVRSASARARGGTGGDATDTLSGPPLPSNAVGGAGGAAIAGSVTFRAEQAASLRVDGGFGDFNIRTDSDGGSGGLGVGGGLGGAGGSASGGSVTLDANGGILASEVELYLSASNIGGSGGDGTTNGQSTGGRVTLLAADVGSNGGALLLGPVRIAADGDVAGRTELRASNDGKIDITNLSISVAGTAAATNGNVLTASNGILLQADNASLEIGSELYAETGGSIGFYATGTGEIIANEFLSANADNQIVIRHTGRTASASTVRSGDTYLTAGNSIVADADADADSHLNASGVLAVRAGTEINLGVVTVDNENLFYADDGDLVIGNFAGPAAIVGSGKNVAITSLGGITIGNLQAYDGNVTVRSADIDLSSGSIEAYSPSSPSSITLVNNDSGQTTYVGGFGPRTGYHIDGEELYALRADAVTIETAAATGSTAPLMVVDSFELSTGDANMDLTLRSAGDMEVVGTAILRGEYSNNILSVDATGDLLMIGMGNALRVESSATGDAPAGVLNVKANRVIVTGFVGRERLDSATTAEEYEAALGRSEEGPPSDGSLFADTMNITVTEALFVQNSNGSGEDISTRRGLTYGTGGLNINTAANTIVVINGITSGANGIVSGADALAGVKINGVAPSNASSFNRQSVMNSCLIVNPTVCGSAAFTPTPTDYPIPPIQVIVDNPVSKDEDEVEADDREASTIPDSLISMRDIHPISGAPLVDDPVTGAGNDDLWGPVTE